MQQGNDDFRAFIMVFAFVGAIAYIFMAIVFALAAFASLGFTLLCLCAWNKEIKIGGSVLTPDEAQGFVYRGLAGAVVLPLFVVFVQAIYGLRINPDFWLYFVLGGYVLGSIGVEIMVASNADATQAAQEVLPPQLPAPPPRLPTVPAKPFRFASWDDEGERRPTPRAITCRSIRTTGACRTPRRCGISSTARAKRA